MRPRKAFRITVLGDGGWGTTLALHLHRQRHQVRWWGAFSDYVKVLKRKRVNSRYLPGVKIPKSLSITSSLSEALADSHLIVLAVPSQHLRSVVRLMSKESLKGKSVLNVAKGLEKGTLKRMSEVIKEELGSIPFAVLSGPNIASEIAQCYPASSVVASSKKQLAKEIQSIFMNPRLRIYTSSDVIGVELGGALKNPIAIAAGICDGLGFGSNAKSALVTRGIVEMSRLGVASGGRPETFWGLSGLGDLITTCLAGRNHWFGEQIGKGRSMSSVLTSTSMVIEGVETARAALRLGKRNHVELPIIEQVCAVLFKRRSALAALKLLMQRNPKSEHDRYIKLPTYRR